MATDLFAPSGANPLQQVRVQQPRNARVDFDRSVRSNVLIMEGDVTQSKVHLPRDDRPLTSLQLGLPIVGFQLMCPSTGQLSLEFSISYQNMTKLRVTAGTFISRADVHDTKGTPHVKLPFAIPRNVWTQAVLHIPGVVCHLFKLPSIKWIDGITVSGSARVRRIFACSEESVALVKPSGMLLFTVPAYGPPVWCGMSAPAVGSTAPAQGDRSKQQQESEGSAPNEGGASGGAEEPKKQPFQMKFSRQPNGEVTFTAAQERKPSPPAQPMPAPSGRPVAGGAGGTTSALQELPSDGGARAADPGGARHDDANDVEECLEHGDVAASGAPGGNGRQRSPRTEAIVAALQGRTPSSGAPTTVGGSAASPARTSSAPAITSHNPLQVSYRRLVKEAPATQTPAYYGGVPRREPAEKKDPAASAAAEAEAAWGCVVLDGWGENEDSGADASIAAIVARTLGVATPPTDGADGERRTTPPPVSPSAAKPSAGGAKATGPPPSSTRPGAGKAAPSPTVAGGAGAGGRAAVAGGRSNARGAAGRGAAGPGSPIAAAGRGGGGSGALASMSEDDILAACAASSFREEATNFTFKPKQDRVVGFGVGDLEVERTRSSSDDDSDDDESDSDTVSGSDAGGCCKRR